jgi:hypothetical protein
MEGVIYELRKWGGVAIDWAAFFIGHLALIIKHW